MQVDQSPDANASPIPDSARVMLVRYITDFNTKYQQPGVLTKGSKYVLRSAILTLSAIVLRMKELKTY